MQARYLYRVRIAEQSAPIAVSTSVYRNVLSRSLFSKCTMFPSDSQIFDVRVKRCGAMRAVFLGASRLFLERAATPEYLRPVRMDGALKWVDLPGGAGCD